MKIKENSPRLNNLSVDNVDEKLKNADNLLINGWFFICIPNVDNVGVDHLKKNHSSLGRFNFGTLNTALLLLSALAAWLSYSEFYGSAETCNILMLQATVGSLTQVLFRKILCYN